MPTYDYDCHQCMEHVEIMRSMHDPEILVHDDCGGELQRVFLMPRIQAAALGTRKPKLIRDLAFQKEAISDNESYIRLRKEGHQPKRVTGAHAVEQFATSKFEIESGHRLSSAKVGKKYDETQHFLTKEGGLLPLKKL